MKKIKSLLAVILTLCLAFCFAGCGDEYDNFEPVGVQIIESIAGVQYEVNIDDLKTTKKMWSTFDTLTIDTEKEAEMGSAYLYLCFYDEDQSTLGIFTIYDNGSCCLGEDFQTFYAVDNGEQVYLDLCDIYTEYVSENRNESME